MGKACVEFPNLNSWEHLHVQQLLHRSLPGEGSDDYENTSVSVGDLFMFVPVVQTLTCPFYSDIRMLKNMILLSYSSLNCCNVGIAIINYPPVITIFMGGISINHQFDGWCQWHCYTHMKLVKWDHVDHVHPAGCWRWRRDDVCLHQLRHIRVEDQRGHPKTFLRWKD